MIEIKDFSKFEQKDFKFELKEVTDKRTFTGYASVFNNEDEGDDIVLPGAFSNSIAEIKASKRVLPMLWAHDTRLPIGGYTDLKEDNTGLYCEGFFADGVQQADETYSLMKAGIIDGLSVGYQTKKYEIDQSDPNSWVRKLIELKLFEISVVTFPMNGLARATDVKNNVLKLDERLLEGIFKSELKLSQSAAVSAVAIVKKHLQREAAGGDVPAREAAGLEELLTVLRESRAVIAR